MLIRADKIDPSRSETMRRAPTIARARSLRILVVADSKLSVPPNGYGGTERVLSVLCQGFLRRGHEVVLMGAAGSKNFGRLVVYPWAGQRHYYYRAFCKLSFFTLAALELLRDHDVILAGGRVDYLLPFLWAGRPLLYRFGNPIESRDVASLTARARGPLALVGISDAQRSAFDGPLWHTIHNGTDTRQFRVTTNSGGYLAFLGRLTANKGVDTAIHIARQTGRPLKIAGNLADEAGDRDFFERKVRPHLGQLVEWIGEITVADKSKFLGSACALLMPIRWDEPFGNVAIEALACGTPVIAMSRGAMPEIVRDGVNGYLVSDEAEMIDAVSRIDAISRQTCRQDCEERFAVDPMVERYLEVMESLMR